MDTRAADGTVVWTATATPLTDVGGTWGESFCWLASPRVTSRWSRSKRTNRCVRLRPGWSGSATVMTCPARAPGWSYVASFDQRGQALLYASWAAFSAAPTSPVTAYAQATVRDHVAS